MYNVCYNDTTKYEYKFKYHKTKYFTICNTIDPEG